MLFAGTGDENATDVRVVSDVAPCLLKPRQHPRREGVSLGGPVQRYVGDVIDDVEQHVPACCGVHPDDPSLNLAFRPTGVDCPSGARRAKSHSHGDGLLKWPGGSVCRIEHRESTEYDGFRPESVIFRTFGAIYRSRG